MLVVSVLCVEQDVRRRGLASRLVESLLDMAHRADCQGAAVIVSSQHSERSVHSTMNSTHHTEHITKYSTQYIVNSTQTTSRNLSMASCPRWLCKAPRDVLDVRRL